MKSRARLLALAALLAVNAWNVGASAAAKKAAARGVPPTVVVELFTAQGCASCGAADAWFDRLADRPGVIALTWSVDYWDYLGWKDSFAQAAFTDRQQAYDKRLGPRDVYTPQVIVGGAAEAPGDQPDDVEALVRRAGRARVPAPGIVIRPASVGVGHGSAPKGGAEVWLIRFDPRRQTVEVKDGDNRGKTLQRRNVVRQLARLGSWKGSPVRFTTPPAPESGLASVVLVQSLRLGPILAAKVRPAD
ncbi:MAG: DUF1223 domain-containing protein [Caulobacteraceae bacterium]